MPLLTMTTQRWFALALSATNVFAQPNSNFRRTHPPDRSCSGPIHAQAVQIWETTARPYFTRQIQDGLNRDGDVYVLYYAQEELQSFVEMTRRCKSTKEIDEIASLLNAAFNSLRPLTGDSTNEGWVCRGGSACTAANKRLGKEVQLCSAQFLGLIGAVATDIVETISASQRTQAEDRFLSNASSAMVMHLNRWLSPAYSARVSARLAMTSDSVRDGSPRYFFEDRDLWMMIALSDLSELYQASVITSPRELAAFRQLQLKRNLIAQMFGLFLKRITLTDTLGRTHAMLDEGYWRLYADERYALYTADSTPVACDRDSLGRLSKRSRVPAVAAYIDPTMGWDISHSRRLVPALESFARNEANLSRAFGYQSDAFDAMALQRAFANQITDTIWNRDMQWPLFANFWDGQNGWYRAGYDDGTGDCRPGKAPYSLGEAFATGGFLQWGVSESTIHTLGDRLYEILNTNDPKANAFMTTYYVELGEAGRTPTASQQLWRMTFLADLIGTE